MLIRNGSDVMKKNTNTLTKLNITKEQLSFLKKKFGVSKMEEIEPTVLKKLKEELKSITDKRQKSKTCYKIWDILCYVIFSSLAGIDTWEDIPDFVQFHRDFFKSFLLMTHGIPNWQTIERVMSLIDSKELENILVHFYQTITFNNSLETDIISIDGRVSCGSGRDETNYNEKISPLNVLNAYSNNYGICLASERISDKSNEIPTVPIILSRLKIKDTIVTWDALNTQKKNIEAVKEKKGDYVVPVKKNHTNFNVDLELYFDEKTQEKIIAGRLDTAYFHQEEKSHSCFVRYEYFQTSDIKWYSEWKEWKGLRTFGMVKKTIIKKGEKKVERRYYISSLNVNIELFAKAIRNHWSVENKLHWHLDFTFREDKNNTMNKNALMNLQLINKFCLGMINKLKPFYENRSLRRIRKIMCLDFEGVMVRNICYLCLS